MRLINGDDFIEKATKICADDSVSATEKIGRIIIAATESPTIEAAPVVHGEWATIEDDYAGLIALQCSECNQEYWFEDDPPLKIYNYCPNCGARMDKEV